MTDRPSRVVLPIRDPMRAPWSLSSLHHRPGRLISCGALPDHVEPVSSLSHPRRVGEGISVRGSVNKRQDGRNHLWSHQVSSKKDQTDQINEIDQMNQINQTDQIDQSPVSLVSRVPLVSQSLTQQRYPSRVADVAVTSNLGCAEPRTSNHFHALSPRLESQQSCQTPF